MIGFYFTSPITILAAATFIFAVLALWYFLYLKSKVRELKNQQAYAPLPLLPQDATEPMRYSEYKRRYRRINRDIAIIATEHHADVKATIEEFIDTMRDHGTLRYHFTHYVGKISDSKATQELISTVIKNDHDAIFTLGGTLTRLVRQATSAQVHPAPTVFTRVRSNFWEQEVKKSSTDHMTGVTVASRWPHLIALYLAIKPTMKSVIVPVTNPVQFEFAQEVSLLLSASGVDAHIIRSRSHSDILQAIEQYSDKADSLIRLFDSPKSQEIIELASACARHEITYMSPQHLSSPLGAAVSISSHDEQFGWHAAQKMLSILEEYKEPHTIPITCIGDATQYEIHFNQRAMRSQGLDPNEIIPRLTLNYGTLVHGYSIQNKEDDV